MDSGHIFVHMLVEAPLLGSESWLGALAQTKHETGWHYRHALFQPDVLASQPFCLLLDDLHPCGTCSKMATQWDLGTTRSRRSLVLPFGTEHRYKAPWWIINFCRFHKISLPSSLEACSARSGFKSVFCAFSQFNTALNIGSSFWASAQSVTCICTNAQPVMTHTSCSRWWLPSTMVGSWT